MANKERRTSIRFEPEFYDVLAFYAKQENIDIAEVIRDATASRLKHDLGLTETTWRRCLQQLKAKHGMATPGDTDVTLSEVIKLKKAHTTKKQNKK